MKKLSLFCGSLLIASTMLFVACHKKVEVTIDKFFNVNNATLVEDEMPSPTSNQTIDVSMNGSAISGGASYVTVNTETVAKKILVGMKDQVGYYEIVSPTALRGYAYSFVLMVDQNIDLGEEENAFNVQVAIVDENGDISQIWEAPVSLIEVGTGNLQVSLTFSNNKDVDLHLIEPEQEELDYNERHVYYGNSVSPNGGELDLDSNAGCSIDGINNENITYGDEAYVAPGTYTVYVDMWENCDEDLGETTWVLTVLYGGQLIATQLGGNPCTGVFPADEPSNFANLDSENCPPRLTFTIPDTGQKRTKTFEPKPLSESAKAKVAAEK